MEPDESGMLQHTNWKIEQYKWSKKILKWDFPVRDQRKTFVGNELLKTSKKMTGMRNSGGVLKQRMHKGKVSMNKKKGCPCFF